MDADLIEEYQRRRQTPEGQRNHARAMETLRKLRSGEYDPRPGIGPEELWADLVRRGEPLWRALREGWLCW